MTATIRPAPPASMRRRGRHPTAAVAPGAADSPDAPYLRRWLGHRTPQHRDLLRNIDAASRIALDHVRATC